ncbi:YhcG family protein [Flavobacterium sp. fv08]|uniref:PDDEXK nuclease domain-containing protein n=1 Tax=Flavobacterium sp. fv08 TaxID=1761784 RepID=UPI0008C0364E|nr:PDDEXK nuclease domain-containing protein [Flavobacterium sp. fv08]SEP06131.1 Predicted nuclease of restriction endonuclease-like (RecB) superfamily, DUF1016 family [Flavobacterium sp. fv08]
MEDKIVYDNDSLISELSQMIEQTQHQITSQANSALTMLFWHIGTRINNNILENKRADYGKQIVVTVSRQLMKQYGRSFEEKNLRRMLQFSEKFKDREIVVTLSRQLSWSHFLVLLPLKDEEARLFYANFASGIGVRELRKKISNKEYERTSIANIRNTVTPDVRNSFKDPYFLDFLGLSDTYLEKDLEDAVLREIEKFILELSRGLSFIERQKRMIIDGEDFYLDLLFYHRKLRRLVAVELKLGKFQAKYKGQMELYLKWLDRYEKTEGELPPVGIILCSESNQEQVQLLEMHKDGIMVAEYWTELPSKRELEKKIHSILLDAGERMEAKKLLE